jgi:hypothetical protein
MLLNDLDVASGHLERLVKDAQASPAIAQHYLATEAPGVRDALGGLLALSAKFRATLRGGVEQLFNQLVRPRLRTFVPDVYRDAGYALDDAADAAQAGALPRRFARALDGVLDGFRAPLAPRNFRLFFGLLLDVLVRPWEKYVMTLRFNEVGLHAREPR